MSDALDQLGKQILRDTEAFVAKVQRGLEFRDHDREFFDELHPDPPRRGVARRESTSAPATSVAGHGTFGLPVAGGVLGDRFGMRMHPIDKVLKMHAGVDIKAPRGTAVAAAGDGVVIFAGSRRGYGNTVEIKHPDGSMSRYAHLDSVSVIGGDRVKRGDLIGDVGSTGKATGPHLHYELHHDGKAVDPLRLIARGE